MVSVQEQEAEGSGGGSGGVAVMCVVCGVVSTLGVKSQG